MKNLKILPLVFSLGFGGTSLLIDSNPDLIKAKFGVVMFMILISAGATIFDDIPKIKNKFGNKN
jgi:hypothetical protein